MNIFQHQSRMDFLCKTNYLQYCTIYGILVLGHQLISFKMIVMVCTVDIRRNVT